ncbi:PD-(D/E)XK nuclease family protein [Synoicihabitans lomoniglobus]|uniref:PD-(D/E)XK nuclease family protein n=1 Tax=Synoicihabitans lomoniglobus TaxID=2909285 RepID=UPI002ED60569|nr:PD-(D/E)XK nuclease family protein [Opitutaceae bacterium LMO-M01]
MLPWDQPVPRTVAKWLAEEVAWRGDEPLDLGDWVVVVPSRGAGRRLREALAVLAAASGQAVFPPRVMMPEALPATLAALPAIASRSEAQMAWVRVLLEARLSEYRAVIPLDPPRRDFNWAHALATRLQRVQGELGEEGLRMVDVAATPDFPETVRWQQLARLEGAFDDVLAGAGLTARAAAERRALSAVTLPPGCRRAAVLAAPDLLAVARRYLEALAMHVRVDVVVVGEPDEDGAARFDAWGRPRTDHWSPRPFALPAFDQQVRLEPDPSAQAQRIATIAAQAPEPDEWLTVTLADPAVAAPLQNELTNAGLPCFNPEGEPWARGPLYGLLGGWAELLAEPSVRAVGHLLHQPDLLKYWSASPVDFSAETLLKQWDRLRGEFLPTDLAAAQRQAARFPMLARALADLDRWRQRLLREPFGESAIAVLGEFYAGRAIASGSALADAAEHWVETVQTVDRAARLYDALTTAERWQWALRVFTEGARFGPKPAGALELGGWLELLWSDAPRLVLAGANDGCLPDAVSGDAFLPEALREMLGLRTNAERLARDAYLLAAAVASRPGPRDVEILVGKTTRAGEPLRPSSLLLLTRDADLPGRVRHLFRAAASRGANLPWRRAWRMDPRQAPPPVRVSVTALRDWMACPFRFYLKHVLRMEALDLAKVELDARDFGTLVHAALQAMGEDEALRDSADEAILSAGLLAKFDAEAQARFGENRSLPLVIQLESGRQRLRRAAALQAQIRTDGWRIEAVEHEFSIPIGPLQVRGKIDRIDRHDDGRVRVIDYKTSDAPAAPLDAHLGRVREADLARPEWLRWEWAGKEKRWVDLQLPLYCRALAADYGTELSCAYFNLSKAVGETDLSFWPEGDPALQAAAEACAEHIAAAIGAGEFWPPVEEMGWGDEDWATLFHHGVAASVADGWIQQGGAS